MVLEDLSRVNGQEQERKYEKEGKQYLKLDRYGEDTVGIYARTSASTLQFLDYVESKDLEAEPRDFNEPSDLAKSTWVEAEAEDYILRWLEDEDSDDWNWISFEGRYSEEIEELFLSYAPSNPENRNPEVLRVFYELFGKEETRERLEELPVDSPR